MSQIPELLLQRELGCFLNGTNAHKARWSSQSFARAARASDSIVLKLKETGQLTVGSARSRVHTACWDETGTLLVTAGDDCTLRIWNQQQSRLLRGFDPVSCNVTCTAASGRHGAFLKPQTVLVRREVNHVCYVWSSYPAQEGRSWWLEQQTDRCA